MIGDNRGMKGTNMMPKPTLFTTLRCVLLGALAVFVATQFVCIADAESISNGTSVVRIPIAAIDTGKGNFFDSQSFDPAVLVNPEDSSQLIMFFSGMAAPVARGAGERMNNVLCLITNPHRCLR